MKNVFHCIYANYFKKIIQDNGIKSLVDLKVEITRTHAEFIGQFKQYFPNCPDFKSLKKAMVQEC